MNEMRYMIAFAILLERDKLIRHLKETKHTKKSIIALKDNRKLHNKGNLITETSWICNQKLFMKTHIIQYLQKIYKH